ncbi:hypothetical protein [Kribbella jejuensis]|uniref:Uncharacterized protein n=1 Tax=Kribbella jejuensis TaxID=236068 RepID=A0A542E6Z4_9ACTN|nr:hypothetical protein [Kribbella jejuensis]TQJ11111.1 hypothetical protein FB475_4019 [Kribbella jejuensis]
MTETPQSPAPGQNNPGADPIHNLPSPAVQPPPFGQQPQYGQPMPPQNLPTGPVLVTIGDIAVEQQRIVTPAGVMPTHGANWSAMDMSRTEEKIPAWAIVLAIIFALACLLGLLFLLVKERKTTGFVQVTVQYGNRTHNTHVGVSSPDQVADVLARVNYARTLCV